MIGPGLLEDETPHKTLRLLLCSPNKASGEPGPLVRGQSPQGEEVPSVKMLNMR